eukprot:3450395-Prymnesium_polylepis.2
MGRLSASPSASTARCSLTAARSLALARSALRAAIISAMAAFCCASASMRRGGRAAQRHVRPYQSST